MGLPKLTLALTNIPCLGFPKVNIHACGILDFEISGYMREVNFSPKKSPKTTPKKLTIPLKKPGALFSKKLPQKTKKLP